MAMSMFGLREGRAAPAGVAEQTPTDVKPYLDGEPRSSDAEIAETSEFRSGSSEDSAISGISALKPRCLASRILRP